MGAKRRPGESGTRILGVVLGVLCTLCLLCLWSCGPRHLSALGNPGDHCTEATACPEGTHCREADDGFRCVGRETGFSAPPPERDVASSFNQQNQSQSDEPEDEVEMDLSEDEDDEDDEESDGYVPPSRRRRGRR